MISQARDKGDFFTFDEFLFSTIYSFTAPSVLQSDLPHVLKCPCSVRLDLEGIFFSFPFFVVADKIRSRVLIATCSVAFLFLDTEKKLKAQRDRYENSLLV